MMMNKNGTKRLCSRLDAVTIFPLYPFSTYCRIKDLPVCNTWVISMHFK